MGRKGDRINLRPGVFFHKIGGLDGPGPSAASSFRHEPLAAMVSCLFSHPSIKKGPAGMTAAAKITRMRGSGHLAVEAAWAAAARKSTKSKPCAPPATVTASGIPARYLRGIAMPSNARKEAPSSIPTTRS